MDTDSLYLALAKKELEDCLRPEMNAEWEPLRSEDCTDSFITDAVGYFPRMCCDKDKNYDKREPCLFTEKFRCSERLCLRCKAYCYYEKPLAS